MSRQNDWTSIVPMLQVMQKSCPDVTVCNVSGYVTQRISKANIRRCACLYRGANMRHVEAKADNWCRIGQRSTCLIMSGRRTRHSMELPQNTWWWMGNTSAWTNRRDC